MLCETSAALRGVLKAVLPFLLLWVAANYSFSQSLGRVSASAATSLMSSNAAMVCVLSALLLSEGFTVEKVHFAFHISLLLLNLTNLNF